MPLTPERAVAEALARLAADVRVGVAVSGGGDSMALLHAAVLAAPGRVVAATVDHGLRTGSEEEARAVGRACADLGVPHAVLRWDDAGRGNLQERAREGRRRLLGTWAREFAAEAVLLGHTADDQAETVLLRLARGSGVDGLSGMPARFAAEGVEWERPFLGLTREALRGWLSARGIAWAEDPSNEDPRFDRARVRAMMAALSDLGLTRARLLRTAAHMGRAQASLEARADAAWSEVREDGAALLLPLAWVAALEHEDTAPRLLARALMQVGGRDRRPPWEALRRLALAVRGGRAATLWGCRVSCEGDLLRIAPEPGRRRP